MPYPLYRGKHAERSATEPSTFFGATDAVPEAVVLCYQPPVYEYATEAYDGRLYDPGHPRYELHVLSELGGSVGAVGDLGIGGPATARNVEELVVRGVEAFAVVGVAGGLQRDVALGDVVVADRALRDEGTSYHYLPPGRDVAAPGSLADALAETARERGETVHRGTTWTTDAMFRETVPEVEQYADEGVLTTDMEAASLYAVAEYRDADAGAAFVVSDYVGPDEWTAHLDDTWEHLERLFDHAVDALADWA